MSDSPPLSAAGKSHKSHIVIVTDAWYPQVNGVVRVLAETKRALEKDGYKVSLITPAGFWSLPCPSYAEIRLCLFAGRRVAGLLAGLAADKIHIATEGPLGLAARRYAVGRGLRFTTAYHTRFPEYVRARWGVPLAWSYAYLRWFHSRSAAMMTPSPSIARAMTAWRVGSPVVWLPGVDVKHFKPVPATSKNNRPIYLYVGRVAVEKNIEAFLDCDLAGEKWVVGGGPDLTKLKRRYPQVKFWGMKSTDELPALYSRASVFVFPSKTDTFGLVLLEAMACGLPVAAYPVAGPLDVVGGSEAAVLDEDLARAAKQALTIDRQKPRRYAEGFTWQVAAKTFAKHLVPAAGGGKHG